MERGTAVDPRNAPRAISAAAKALGISDVGLHTLRHSFATRMLAAGVPLHTVSELLGHSLVAVTGGVYGHVSTMGARFAVQRLSAAMGCGERMPLLHQWLHGSKEAASVFLRNGHVADRKRQQQYRQHSLVRVRGAAGVVRTGVWTAWSRWPMYPNMKRAKDAASGHAAMWVDIDI
jgi:hypothetical protein